MAGQDRVARSMYRLTGKGNGSRTGKTVSPYSSPVKRPKPQKPRSEKPNRRKVGSCSYGILRAPRGAFYGNEQTVIRGTPLNEASSLPRDPRALLDIIYERMKGSGESPETEAFMTTAGSLRSGVVAADLRAALAEAAALIFGLTVVDKQATAARRSAR